MIIKKYYKNRVINKITDPEGAPGQYQSGQHYYHGRNAEQTPSPFSSMSNSSSRYTLSFFNFLRKKTIVDISIKMFCKQKIKNNIPSQ